MNDIEFVRRIKSNKWETKDQLPMTYIKEFLSLLEENLNFKNLEDPNYLNNLFPVLSKNLCTKWKVLPSKGEINEAYLQGLKKGEIKANSLFESMIIVKSTRSNSGELEVTTTLPGEGISCKYDCSMCPKQPGMPRSYISSEGSIIQGIIERFDAFQQTMRRFIQYEYKMGHTIDKVLHILLGGTFHSYDENVIEEYITKLYYCSNMYHHFSIRKNGKYVSVVEEWLKGKPFMNHTSVMIGSLGEVIKSLRPMKSLEEEKAENTFSKCGRITGIVIETRPDQISYKTMYDLRRYGVTRVQLGIQHIDDNILKIMNRQHNMTASEKAIKYLRDNGFKIDGHLMPNCPGSTNKSDTNMLKQVFQGENLQLDYCKLYICLDVPFTKIREWKHRAIQMKNIGLEKDLVRIDKWMKTGDFIALQNYALSHNKKKEDIFVWCDRAENEYEEFLEFLLDSIKLIPPWVRLNRFQRDFPESSDKNLGLGYTSTTLRSNLQQICMESLKERGLKSSDIRSREIRKRVFQNLERDAMIYIRTYRANEGFEYFISIEVPTLLYNKNEVNDVTNPDEAVILGLIRLRIPDADIAPIFRPPFYYLNTFKKKRTLRVRELHVYGTLISGEANGNSQHKGIGKFLLKVAEYIAYKHNLESIAIIAGVGVQDYYRKCGYEKSSDNDYMVKSIDDNAIKTNAVLFNNQYNYNDFSNYNSNIYSIYWRNTYVLGKKEYPSNTSYKPNLVVLKHLEYNYKVVFLTMLSIYMSIWIAVVAVVLYVF